MVKIGQIEISGPGRPPRSRREMKRRLRRLARELGLEIRFVTRKRKEMSVCDVALRQALVCEGVGGQLWPMSRVIFNALHEVAHWIHYNEGMFRSYYGRPYYDGWLPAKPKDILRLALRTERHADALARKLGLEIFGLRGLGAESIYNYTEHARPFLRNYYEDYLKNHRGGRTRQCTSN